MPSLVTQSLTLLQPLTKALDNAQTQAIRALEALYSTLNKERKDAASEDVIARVLPLLKRGFSDAEIERVLRQVAPRVTAAQRRHLLAQIRAHFGVDLFAAEPSLKRAVSKWTTENVKLIRSIPNDLAVDIGKTVQDAALRGTTWRDLSAQISERFDVARSRARVIARDQIGKLFSQVARERQERLGFTRYIWRTAGDPRVRSEHEARDGKVFSWSDPPHDGHPGEPVLCRCEAEPDFSQLATNA